jgi:hypothetical protein
MNLLATSLMTHAYLYAPADKAKYKTWVLEYLQAWEARTAANGGILPGTAAPPLSIWSYLYSYPLSCEMLGLTTRVACAWGHAADNVGPTGKVGECMPNGQWWGGYYGYRWCVAMLYRLSFVPRHPWLWYG